MHIHATARRPRLAHVLTGGSRVRVPIRSVASQRARELRPRRIVCFDRQSPVPAQTREEQLAVELLRDAPKRPRAVAERLCGHVRRVSRCPVVAAPVKVDEHEVGVGGRRAIHDAVPDVDVREPGAPVDGACRLSVDLNLG